MTAKSDRAKKLLEDETLTEAFSNLREYYLKQIEIIPLHADNTAEALKEIQKMLYLLKQVRNNLEQMLKDGKLEDFNVEYKGDLGNKYHGRVN